jgi:serine/threonine-protein kinase
VLLRRPPAPVAPPTAGETAAASPEGALHADEARRMRVFAPFVLALALIVPLVCELLGGDRTARLGLYAGLALAAVTGAWVARAARDPAGYRAHHHVIFGLACAATMVSAFHYFGVLSAVLMVVPFGAFIFSINQSFRGAFAITAVLVVAYLALALLVIFDVVPDRGLIQPVGVSRTGQLLVVGLVNFVYVATFVMARLIRRSTENAFAELARANRQLAQRELLLAEARQDLHRALQVGGHGRFTGQAFGRYRLGPLLGRGGMGEVYEASSEDGAACAVKLLHPHLAAEPAHYQRFLREARLAASLPSANVVRVLELAREGESPPYLVMERLHGHDLAELLKARQRLDLAEVVELVRQVANGLDAAHAAGVVHRDLKPQNLFCSEGLNGRVWKILDFGASKLTEQQGSLTQGGIIGTPQYMAPEQARGENVDARADIYALAVIAYRALTGTPAFSGPDVPAVLFAVTHRMPPRPGDIVDVPPQLDDVLLVGLAKSPDDRFARASDLAEHVAAAVDGRIHQEVRSKAWRLAEQWPWGTHRFG